MFPRRSPHILHEKHSTLTVKIAGFNRAQLLHSDQLQGFVFGSRNEHRAEVLHPVVTA
jgi:hypothetical protein